LTSELLIEKEDSHQAIDLIDLLRAQGLDAELADSPGWDVVVGGPVEEAEEILRELKA
jgi:predicted NAD/FAD-binding protein